jgi:nanoRNase/pAp phosphatase (c-di-AMP/oligoRNAs hydrolase)
MRDMIGYCRTMSVDEILDLPDVQERVRRYFEQEDAYRQMVMDHSRTEGNVIVLDFRDVDDFLSGNRFIEYALYPEQNVSLRTIWGKGKQNQVLTVGHSIINRTCRTNVGSLMLGYGGGGHEKVGTCQVPVEDADRVMRELIDRLKANG